MAALRASSTRTMTLAGGIAAIVLAGAAPAGAYVRAHSAEGKPLAWTTPRIRIVQSSATSRDLSAADVQAAIRVALAAWSHPTIACTAVELALAPGTDAPPVVAPDGNSTLIFREDTWCDGATCHDPALLALTTVFMRSDGTIVDADIEVNAVGHRWTNLAEGGASPDGARDLANTLTHEIGHVLGFADNCRLGGASPGVPAEDHAGNPLPECRMASSAVRAATMFVPITDVNETGRRTLEADDVRAVCDVYPRGATIDAGEDAAADAARADDAARPDRDAGAAAALDAPATGAADGANDGRAPAAAGDGCGCRTGGAAGGPSSIAFAMMLGWLTLRRRGRAPSR